ncbi:sugar phosphate isomerase/epimerase family protein [Dictyobacter aurantiacus]|uniref:Sugar phosphate isomerase n=1 Tax=Dictyobacter aurantiacus TaxID=1936993 RepID=A0A401ZT63_9CHLR|nr:sugar phosphate isomerase/epimerase [Dictyobacter aurantiacus]GCE09970.1 sugar phosphate isomerase [Dictyobacter aurantiacus]
MPKPIALQLYTVRRQVANDFQGVLRRVADIGYVGVEGGLDFFSDEQSARLHLIHELGLQIPSVGIGKLPIDEAGQRHLERAAQAGCKYVMVSQFADDFKSVDGVKAVAERLNAADEIIRRAGLTLCYHNHWWEFENRFDGKSAHEVLRGYVAPTVSFELDVYWAQTGGVDPVTEVRALGSRAPLLHIKDGPAVQGQPMTAVGEGKVDIAGVIQAAQNSAQWLIIELDECATDMLEAVEKSYTYLISKGLAQGNKG